MITGWTTQPVAGRLLDALLPVPHVVRYRDRAPVAIRVPGAEILVVRQADANEAAMVGGLNADGESAMEVTITIRAVFHGILVDRVGVDLWSQLRFQPCGEAPSTSWQQCE